MTVETKNLESLFSKIENEGWSIKPEVENAYWLGKCSPQGQDFSIIVEGETESELIASIYKAYKDFDVSYETYLWLDSTGHGIKGAPYHMKDVLHDMEICHQRILALFNHLSGFQSSPSSQNDTINIESEIVSIIKKIGVPAHFNGYAYLREAIKLCFEDAEALKSITHIVYPHIAFKFRTTTSRAERGIRHAIEVAWERGNKEAISSMLGYTGIPLKSKPTNKAFIGAVVEKLKDEMM